MLFEEMIEFELNIQKDRLKYIDAALGLKTYCSFPPRKIYIEPTNICNYRCLHCVHDGALTRKKGYLDVDLYKKRIDEIEHLRLHSKIQFTGVGEPLLHPQWDKIIGYASGKGFFTLLNSNASLFSPENCERLVKSGLDYLHVSIDGITKDTYEKIRRGGDFNNVISNLFNLFEARHKLKGYHLAVVLGIIDQDGNRAELEKFLDFFSDWPFHHVVSGELFNHMGAIEEASQNYVDKQSQALETYPICNTPWDILSVNCDGYAVGCNYDFDNRFVVGDMNKQGLLEIWNSEEMQKFRQSVLDRNYSEIEKKGPMCSECTIKWQEDYFLPTDYSFEVCRMKEYLTRAIDRSAHHAKRNAEFRDKEKILLENRKEILDKLFSMSGA